MNPTSPLAADAPPDLEQPSRALIIASTLGLITGSLIAAAAVLVVITLIAGIDLSLREYAGATLLLVFLRP